MRLVTDRPKALTGAFVLMGIVSDSSISYACLFNTSDGKTYIEEMWWSMGVGGNEATSNLREVSDDKEWQSVYDFVTKQTTIFSPKKLRMALNQAGTRGVSQIDSVLRSKDFPYVKRKVDPNNPLKVGIPRG